ncbi:MAG: Bcr/CflA family efflux MFS transporter [Alphaproteobacteria bacterium]|jgi:DHA1 family bicyclomycin/chloramphenicol resistance-like MFS transporter|nr:Bcr/CflA family efflux MFS transporter [Alphaproteobacteria bacterium]
MTGFVPLSTIALLVAAAGLGPLSMGLFVPSMPGLQAVFGTDYGHVQLTFSLYLVGLGLGQLTYGPLSDRFGRKPVLMAGIAVFVAASIICALSTSIDMLIAARFAQALGGSAGIVLGRAIVRDLVPTDRAASVIAYLTVAFMVAPMVGPLAGGHLDDWLGWRAGFVLVAAAGLVVVAAIARKLPESHQRPVALPGVGGLARSFGSLLRTPRFAAYALTTAMTTAAFMAFMGGGPYVVIDLMGLTPADYGMLFAIGAGGYMAGNLVSGRLSGRIGVDRMILAGTIVATAATLAMTAFGLAGQLSALSLFATLTIMAAANGLTMPNGLAGAIGSRPDLAGTASGLAGFLQMTLGCLASIAVGAMLGATALPLVLMLLATSVAALVIHAVSLGRRSDPVPPVAPAG